MAQFGKNKEKIETLSTRWIEAGLKGRRVVSEGVIDVVCVTYFDESARLIAASEVEKKIIQFTCELGIPVDQCIWNLGLGMDHMGPHRLDVHFGENAFRIYFTDHELACYWGPVETPSTDNRLRELMGRLSDLLLALKADDLSAPPSSGIPLHECTSHHYFKKYVRRRTK